MDHFGGQSLATDGPLTLIDFGKLDPNNLTKRLTGDIDHRLGDPFDEGVFLRRRPGIPEYVDRYQWHFRVPSLVPAEVLGVQRINAARGLGIASSRIEAPNYRFCS
jgi:hypothetical protein